MKSRVVTLGATVIVAMSAVVAGQTAVHGAGPETRASYLFAFEGRNAELKSIDPAGKRFQLIVPLRGPNHRVTWFTDRPVRDAGLVKMKDFIGLWESPGRDSFKADPPNVAVVFGQTTMIATMRNPRIVINGDGTENFVTTLTLVRGKALDDIARDASGISAHAKRSGTNTQPSAGRIPNVAVFVDISPIYFNLCPSGSCSIDEGTEVA
jgi:hypothetical protein